MKKVVLSFLVVVFLGALIGVGVWFLDKIE